MTETLKHGYSSESILRQLSNKYHYGRVKMDFNKLCVLGVWTKVASAMEGLRKYLSQLAVELIIVNL